MPKPRNTRGLDRDNNGDPGGSLPKQVPMIDIDSGAVLVVGVDERDQHLADQTARLANAFDLEVAGRRDLIPHL